MTLPPPLARITITLLKFHMMLFSKRLSEEAPPIESPYPSPPGLGFGVSCRYESRTTQRKALERATLPPFDHSDSTFFTQL